MQNQFRNCPICNSSDVQNLYDNKFEKIENINLTYVVCSCINCGFIYSNYIPEDSVYSEYYSNFSKYDVYDSLEKIPPLDNEVAELTVNFLYDNNIKVSSVYDIGCSIGLFLSKVKSSDSNILCHGIDPSPNSRKIARKLFDIEVEIGFYEGKTSLVNYDLISSCSVLEHIKDVRSFINNISRNVKNGSYLLFLVPSLNDFSELNGEWLGELSIEHINYFNEKSINNLLVEFGYSKVVYQRIRLTNGQYILIFLGKLEEKTVNSLNKDIEGVQNFNKYLNNSNVLLENIKDIFSSINEPYLLFGAGSHTLRLLKLDCVEKNPPICIIDSNKNIQDKYLGNFIINAPTIKSIDKSIPVVISSYKGVESIKNTLKLNGFTGKVIELY